MSLRDHRVEPDANLCGLSPAMRMVLCAMATGGNIYCWRGGYVQLDGEGKPRPPLYAKVTIEALIERGLLRKWALISSGPKRIQVTLTGTGAWYARTAARLQARDILRERRA